MLDKYPTAARHALVIARDPRLQGPLDLTHRDIPLLLHMKAVGEGWAEGEQQREAVAGGPALEPFAFGFHSVPSMRRLHLHVISQVGWGHVDSKDPQGMSVWDIDLLVVQDFVSDALKTKRHWNSFTTSFFLDIDKVLEELQERGRLSYSLAEKEEMLKLPLKCHRCGRPAGNMPQLKAHVAACRATVPGTVAI
jgi:aprataxin